MEIFDINGIETTLIKTDKFKTITFLISFFGEFSKANATKRTLLSRVLANSTANYPNKKLLANHLFDLYDLNVSVSNSAIHKTSMTNFVIEGIHPQFVKENSYFDNLFIFIKELIFNPNIKDNGFDELVFNEEKKMLAETIKNVYNNKPYFAMKRLFEEMAKDEILSVSSLGTLEDLEKITKNTLYEFYLGIINKELIKIHVIGDLDKNQLLEKLSLLDFKINNPKLVSSYSENIKVNEVKEIIEKQKINQTLLQMGFRTSITYSDDLYLSLVLVNLMLGGMASSDLFKVVREENSLAYSVDSTLYTADKVMVITAGIDRENYLLTKDLIVSVVDKYKAGKIRKKLLDTAKVNLISILNESKDDPLSTLAFIAKSKLHNTYGLNEMIEEVKKVDIQDTIKASKMLTLDTIYLLEGEVDE